MAPRDPAAQRAWAEVLRPVAEQLAEFAPRLTDEIAAAILAAVPGVFDDPDSAAENRASTEASLVSIAHAMARAEDPTRIELPAATVAFGRTAVQRRVGSGVISHVYRAAHEVLWRWILAHIGEHSRDQRQLMQAVGLASAWLFACESVFVKAAEELYEAEQQQWLRSAAAVRGETINQIVEGSESNLERAESRLRYKLGRHHVAVTAWTQSAADLEDPSAVEAELGRAAELLGGESTLFHSTGLRSGVLWVGRDRAFDAETLASACHRLKPADGTRLAFGEPGHGLAGFRRTYFEAGHARRVALLRGTEAPPVSRYADQAVVAMATLDPDQAAIFVDRVLGPLSKPDAAVRRTAETVAAYLAENGSRVRTAQRLGIHGNTVRYRILQAERALGRSLDVGSVDLHVALMLLPAVRSRLKG